LNVLRRLGARLVPISLPDKLPIDELRIILYAEAAAAFDELTREPDQVPAGWRPYFQAGQFLTAGDYLRANRVRALLVREMEAAMDKVDLYVGGDDLVLTNLTGHPQVVLPNGLVRRGKARVPASLTFTGRLFGEAELLAVAHAYQQATGHHLQRPPLKSARKSD
jgi:Asp-tRNA(Asn)/Glu-tRNA(Gln) amidotransferase A subunit family amidase